MEGSFVEEETFQHPIDAKTTILFMPKVSITFRNIFKRKEFCVQRVSCDNVRSFEMSFYHVVDYRHVAIKLFVQSEKDFIHKP